MPIHSRESTAPENSAALSDGLRVLTALLEYRISSRIAPMKMVTNHVYSPSIDPLSVSVVFLFSSYLFA
jgi:hypothetical protein